MTTVDVTVKMVLDRWNGSIANLTKLLNNLTDEQLQRDIVPGKNSGTYLLGHLVAVHDDMLALMNMGEKLFPELIEPFIKQADKVATKTPSVAELREMWKKQNDHFQDIFEKMKPEEWFEKNAVVSDEDFLNEPHRNKLNVIITRTSHLQYHMGQLRLLS